MHYLFEANFANGGNVEVVLVDKDGEEIERLLGFNEIYQMFIKKNIESRTNEPKVLTWFNSNFKNWLKNEAPGYNSQNNYYSSDKKFRDALYPDLDAVLDDLEDEDTHNLTKDELLAMFPEYIRKSPDTAQIFAGGRKFRLPRILEKMSGELIDYLNAVVINQTDRNQQIMPDVYFARDLTKVSPADAIDTARAYHVYLERVRDKVSKEQMKQMYKQLGDDDFTVLEKFPGGSRLVQAKSGKYVECEGKAMGHCVGTYGNSVRNKSVIIRSLQDKDGLPVATFELSANGETIRQLKGPKNGPINPDYHKILQKYIKDEGLKFNTGGGYGSGDYKFIGLESPDLSKLKLDEATSRKKSDDEDAPKRTRFADKSAFKDLNFGKRDDKLPSAPKKDDTKSSDGWQEKTVKLNKASADDTRKAMKDVKLDLQSLLLMMNMDLSGLEDEIEMTYDLMIPTSSKLPKVISAALRAAGKEDPKWHMVRNLPGYMSQGIRAIGRQVFSPFTSTKIEDIQVIANLGGSGPNTKAEINAVAGFLMKNGTKINDASMEFQERIPGYSAEMKVFTFANYTFLLVKDQAGEYIYSWPSTDNKKAVADKTLDMLK